MTQKLDLSQLAVDRTPQATSPAPHGKRRLVTRYLLPAGMLTAFAALLVWAAKDSVLPATPVTIVPVVLSRAEVQESGAPLFQAAGWIEPRPTATLIAALAPGVIEKLLVVEGQDVVAQQPIAQLADTDARIAMQQAEAEIKLRAADLAGAKAAAVEARIKLEQPVHLEAELAEAESQWAQANTELSNLPFAIESAQAKERLAREIFEGKKLAGDAIPGRSLQKAQVEMEAAQSTVSELKARRPRLEEQVQALERRKSAVKKRYELKAEEHRKLAEAEALVQSCEAKVRQAELAAETARIQLQRMTIRAPVAGKILALLASPGDRLGGMDPQSSRDASNVASLFDPQSLQVRVDVRLEDVPQVQPGQPARIETAAFPGGLEGEVLRATSQADLQKNTLQVKVAIKSPPGVLKPDMLTQVTFLARERPRSASAASENPLRLLVPRQLVASAEGDSFAWVADREGNAARKKPLRLGRAGTAELVEVLEGLAATDKLIVSPRDGLEDGQRIKIVGEEQSK